MLTFPESSGRRRRSAGRFLRAADAEGRREHLEQGSPESGKAVPGFQPSWSSCVPNRTTAVAAGGCQLRVFEGVAKSQSPMKAQVFKSQSPMQAQVFKPTTVHMNGLTSGHSFQSSGVVRSQFQNNYFAEMGSFQGGLTFKDQRFLCLSTVGSNVTKKKRMMKKYQLLDSEGPSANVLVQERVPPSQTSRVERLGAKLEPM